MLPLHTLPISRKPRERALTDGVGALTLQEAVSLLLGSGAAGCDVRVVSEAVCGALREGRVSPRELLAIKGIGPAKAALVAAALHIGKLVEQYQPPIFSEPAHIYGACQDLLTQPQEQLAVFYMNVRGQPLRREIVCIGTATASLLHPREVFRPAIVQNAAHIILAHNHPSGNPSPSEADLVATKKIAAAGRNIGIELLDHVVCARSGYVSLRQTHPQIFF